MNPLNLSNYTNTGVAGGTQPISAPTQTGAQPSWWERALPTVGGILGGIVTAPLEALDAVSGAGGTALNVAGASAGDTFGKYLENKLTGQGGGNGLVGAALEGGVGQAGGDLLGAGVSKLASGGAKGAENLATDTLQSQFKSPIDRSVVSDLSKSGMSNAQEVADITPKLSGPQGAYTNMVTNKLAEAGQNGTRVNVSGLDSQLGQLLQGGESGTGAEILSNAQRKNVSDVVQRIISPDNLNAIPDADKAIMTTTPDKTYEAFTKLRNASYAPNLFNAAPGTANKAISQIYGKMASILKDSSFTPDGINPLTLSDTDKSQLIDSIASLKDTNPSVYASEVGKIGKAGPLSDLNDMQSNWVQASKALEKGAVTGAAKTGTSASDIAAGVAPLTLAHPVLSAGGLLMKSGTADKVGSNVLGKGSKVLSSDIVKKALPLLTRAATVAAANIPNDAASPTGTSAIPTTMGQSVNGGTMNPNPTTNPEAAYYQQLLAQLQAQPADAQTNAILSQLGQTAPIIQKQDQAAPVLSSILNQYQNAGGAQGAGGIASEISSLLPGSSANVYNSQRATEAASVANLLGIPLAQAQALLPSLMANQATAGNQTGALQSILSSITQPTQGTLATLPTQ